MHTQRFGQPNTGQVTTVDIAIARTSLSILLAQLKSLTFLEASILVIKPVIYMEQRLDLKKQISIFGLFCTAPNEQNVFLVDTLGG